MDIVARKVAIERGLQPQHGHGQRRAQFMRRVGSQRAFHIQSVRQALQHAVDVFAHGTWLQRHPADVDRTEIGAAAPADLLLQALQDRQLAAGDAAQQQRQRQQHQHHHRDQRQQGVHQHLDALGERIGQLQVELAVGVLGHVDAPFALVVEALEQRNAEGLRGR